MRLLSLLLALSACAAHQSPEPEELPVLAVLNTTPTPYTAEQIRDAIPAGTELRFRLSTSDDTTLIITTEFIAADAVNTTFRQTMRSEDGEVVGEPTESSAAWTELRDHAAFPLDSAKIEPVRVTTALGEFEALLYTVQADEEPLGPQVQRYWFAKDLAGPPLLLTVEVEGHEVERMEMISRSGLD